MVGMGTAEGQVLFLSSTVVSKFRRCENTVVGVVGLDLEASMGSSLFHYLLPTDSSRSGEVSLGIMENLTACVIDIEGTTDITTGVSTATECVKTTTTIRAQMK